MGTGARHFTRVAAVWLGVLLVAPEAWAQEDEGGGGATFDVTVIHASEGDGGVDPALKDLAGYLKKSFSDYDRFARLDQVAVEVPEGGSGEARLPDDEILKLQYLGADKGFVKVHLTLAGLKTTVKVKDGGLFFQAGRRYDGGILVLAIRARSL